MNNGRTKLRWSEDGTRGKWVFQGNRFTIFKKSGSPFYYTHFRVDGRRYPTALRTTEATVAVLRAQDAWTKARARKWQPEEAPKAKVLARVEEVLACYEKKIATVSEKIDPATVRKNAQTLRRLLWWGKLTPNVKTEDVKISPSTSVLTAGLIDAAVTNYKEAAGNDQLALDGRRRGAASLVRQARSVFKREALRLYREQGLHLPDLTSFLQDRKVTGPLRVHRSIEPAALREMDEAAQALRTEDPALYLVHLAFKFLGLRNVEVAEARLGWFERGPSGQWSFLVTTRGNFRPKASEGVVPVTPEVMGEIKASVGERARCSAEELLAAPLIEAASPSQRTELIYYRHSEFVRRFLPATEFAKSSGELRRWGARMIEGRYGREAAKAFLRHTPRTVAERHYLDRWFPWSQFGGNAGITLADARGPEPTSAAPETWLRGAAAWL